MWSSRTASALRNSSARCRSPRTWRWDCRSSTVWRAPSSPPGSPAVLASRTRSLRRLTTAACSTTSAAPSTRKISAELFPWGTMLENFNPAIYGSPGEIMRGILRSIPDLSPAGSCGRCKSPGTPPRAMRGHPAHMAAMCEVAQMLGERLGLPESVHGLFGQLTERWDGKGGLIGLKGDAIPLRCDRGCRWDVSIQRWVGGQQYAVDVVRTRAGGGHDPHSRRSSAPTPTNWCPTVTSPSGTSSSPASRVTR